MPGEPVTRIANAFKRLVVRPVKRVFRSAISTRLVDFQMHPKMPGDILLTFDDGPHPEYTPLLLDLLDEYGARAVFFMIGERAENCLDVVKACHDRGHVVENHTFSHLNDGVGGRYTRPQVAQDIARCADLMSKATGRTTGLFRPPRGELNRKTWGSARDTAHRIMLWSVEGGEWGGRQHQSAAEISEHLKKTVRKRDIVLLHDDNEKTLTVVRDLLTRLRAEQFDLVSAVESLR